MGEIDAGGEDLAAGIFRMIDHVAAQHADLAHGIEQGDIGGSLGVVERVVVLGVEEARVVDRHHRRLAAPLHPRRAEIDHAVLDELAHALDRFRLRQQHGLAEMRAGIGQRQHLREENALVDLDAVLLALHQPAFGVDLLLRRRQTRHQLGGIKTSSSTRMKPARFLVSLR